VNIQQGARFGSGRLLEIGEKSGIGVNCLVGFDIRIGKNVMMGPDVVVLGENHKIDRTDIPMIEQGHADRQPVTIKDDVWIGARTIILPGVTVGTGVVIGAGAVVTKDVNDFDIVAGNPARVIRNRKDGVVKSS